MKHTLTLLLLLLLSLAAQSQQGVMKVALLAPIDRDNAVNLGTEQIVMGALTSAIANTPGYEAYDRVNMNRCPAVAMEQGRPDNRLRG